jgi:predicted HicB family RNase H-like nuclease
VSEKRLTVEIDEELKREAKAKAAQEGKTLKDKVVELLLTWIRG